MKKNPTNITDFFCIELDRMLSVISTPPNGDASTVPGHEHNNSDEALTAGEKSNLCGLMRINHTGEVCAQALYYGQALFARDKDTRKQLLTAADEEQAHLYWCHLRLEDLQAKASYLNPLWYVSSFALGASAAAFGDKISYGFVMETEKQVESHLQEHIDQLPTSDQKTKAILKQMQADEVRHGEQAQQAGGEELPQMVKSVMEMMAKTMKWLAYRI